MKRIEDFDQEPTLAARRMLLLHSIFYITPGMLQIFMGDEYFSSLAFSKLPETLDRDQAGTYHSGVWVSRGSKIGFFKFTQTMLKLRQLHSVVVKMVIHCSGLVLTVLKSILSATVPR